MGGFDARLSEVSLNRSYVSIPERVWGVLMRFSVKLTPIVGYVSIPERVWGVLMLSIS